MSRDNEEVTLKIAAVVRETDRAALVKFDDETEKWIPFSQISKVVRVGSDPEIVCSRWIAQQKDLMEYAK